MFVKKSYNHKTGKMGMSLLLPESAVTSHLIPAGALSAFCIKREE